MAKSAFPCITLHSPLISKCICWCQAIFTPSLNLCIARAFRPAVDMLVGFSATSSWQMQPLPVPISSHRKTRNCNSPERSCGSFLKKDRCPFSYCVWWCWNIFASRSPRVRCMPTRPSCRMVLTWYFRTLLESFSLSFSAISSVLPKGCPIPNSIFRATRRGAPAAIATADLPTLPISLRLFFCIPGILALRSLLFLYFWKACWMRSAITFWYLSRMRATMRVRLESSRATLRTCRSSYALILSADSFAFSLRGAKTLSMRCHSLNAAMCSLASCSLRARRHLYTWNACLILSALSTCIASTMSRHRRRWM
mmetsp:Transcript_9917/g.22339  ORF Transcript_9917/g.22339 Transcript_9917/m.22339 type:complete len:311 (+) Transcript_9917:907-1839(+)